MAFILFCCDLPFDGQDYKLTNLDFDCIKYIDTYLNTFNTYTYMIMSGPWICWHFNKSSHNKTDLNNQLTRKAETCMERFQGSVDSGLFKSQSLGVGWSLKRGGLISVWNKSEVCDKIHYVLTLKNCTCTITVDATCSRFSSLINQTNIYRSRHTWSYMHCRLDKFLQKDRGWDLHTKRHWK